MWLSRIRRRGRRFIQLAEGVGRRLIRDLVEAEWEWESGGRGRGVMGLGVAGREVALAPTMVAA